VWGRKIKNNMGPISPFGEGKKKINSVYLRVGTGKKKTYM
jgi:hypothetical protein